jgi:hypothetical protein
MTPSRSTSSRIRIGIQAIKINCVYVIGCTAVQIWEEAILYSVCTAVRADLHKGSHSLKYREIVGRPKTRMEIRLDPDLDRDVRLAAAVTGQSVSNFVRRELAAKHVLDAQERAKSNTDSDDKEFNLNV